MGGGGDGVGGGLERLAVGVGREEGSREYPIPVVRPLDKLPFGSLQDLRVSGDPGQSCEARGRHALFHTVNSKTLHLVMLR